MDPNETWKRIFDEDLSDAERSNAALDLLVWLAKDGFVPEYVNGEPGRRSHMVSVCQDRLVADLERLDAFESEDLADVVQAYYDVNGAA